MESYILLRENIKRHWKNMMSLMVLAAMLAMVLGLSVMLWSNSGSYVRSEMERLGFGDLTVWISQNEDEALLINGIESLSDIDKVNVQNIIYSDYEIQGMESDSEGQLIAYSRDDTYDYKFFSDDFTTYQKSVDIEPGEIYLSASMISMFEADISDKLSIRVARNGITKEFVVKGFYEDPFMGSSMIGMKSFLISTEDYEDIKNTADSSGIDALVRSGQMLHIFQNPNSSLSSAELNKLLNEKTDIGKYTEFVHSFEAIYGFMMILQNTFLGFVLAFAVILLIITMIIVGHSISSILETDRKNIGILKTMGFTNKMLEKVHSIMYMLPIAVGFAVGLVLAWVLGVPVCKMTLTTIGLLIPANPTIISWFTMFAAVCLLMYIFLHIKLAGVGKILPMNAIREAAGDNQVYGMENSEKSLPLGKKNLIFTLAVRQIISAKRRYISVFIIATILVFFASLMGRLDSWLGPNGEGMMDAFNPADHHLGVQCIGDITFKEVENVIKEYDNIVDYYELAMPDITFNGVNYTANVITEPGRYHILQGNTCTADNEIVVTQYMAKDWELEIGDSVTLQTATGQGEYVVSGIYQCANDMGENFGMNKEGYLRIAIDSDKIWCGHYFFENESSKTVIMEALENEFMAAVHVHENSWPGLYGIVSTMRILLIVMYIIVAIFIVIVVWLTGSKIMNAEQRNMAIFAAMGFGGNRLRWLFTMRFGCVAVAGGIIGIVLAALITDPIVAMVMNMCGISNFKSAPGMVEILFPAIIISMLFIICAYVLSSKLKKIDVTVLMAD